MFIVCVTVFVKPEHREEFIAATKKNAESARMESGNLRFDFLESVDDPNRFFLYEVYRSEDDFKLHQQSNHYLTWRETVQDWMAQPRQGFKHTNLMPNDEAW